MREDKVDRGLSSAIGRAGRVLLFVGTGLAMMLATSTPAFARPADRNHNKIPDSWEKKFHMSLNRNQANLDADHDGLTNIQEFLSGTNPRVADTGHTGVPDPLKDADHDGVDNAQEFLDGTNPRGADSDHDGVRDGNEIRGTITAFDPLTGILTLASRSHRRSVVTTVTIDADTVLKWKTDHRGDATPTADPTLADLVVGVRVHSVDATTQPDGSLLATRVLLKAEQADGDDEGDHQEADMTAAVVSFDTTSATLVVQAVRHSDHTFDLTVAPGTTFAWGEDIVAPDHVAGSGDLIAGAIVEVRFTELAGAKTAVRVVFHAAVMHKGDSMHDDGPGHDRP